jgi:hypothetical protein
MFLEVAFFSVTKRRYDHMLAAAAITYAGLAVLAFMALCAAGVFAARIRAGREPELQEIPLSSRKVNHASYRNGRTYTGSAATPRPRPRR